MGKKSEIRSVEDLIDHLSDAYEEACVESEDVLREELQKDGYDYDELSRNGVVFLKSLQGEARLRRARRKREAVLDLIGRIEGTTRQRTGEAKHWLRDWFGASKNEDPLT